MVVARQERVYRDRYEHAVDAGAVCDDARWSADSEVVWS